MSKKSSLSLPLGHNRETCGLIQHLLNPNKVEESSFINGLESKNNLAKKNLVMVL